METNELQQRCVEVVKILDGKNGVERDSHVGLAHLVEEVGELAREINSPRLRNREDKESLKKEFADVLILLSALADMHGVNLETAVEVKIKELKERNGV